MNEADFLRSIAENDDSVGRLVLADRLEEAGDSPRAEFLRVQCELSASRHASLPQAGKPAGEISEERRRALRLRERALLDAHRQQWLEAFGLPLKEVCFRGGLIASMRLPQWDGGRLLDAKYASRLVTLTELDLSGLGIGDAGLRAFAERARFPALRKLVLSDNGITDAGVTALAKAAGLPRLDTVYLFQNPTGKRARSVLEQAAGISLKNLDFGERAEGYCMSPGEAEVGRRKYVRMQVLPIVSRYFRAHKRLQSATLCVAQFWADEADDAVHGGLIVSELFEPTLEVSSWGDDESPPDPNVPNTGIKDQGSIGSVIRLWDTDWDENRGSIPLWAAFAPEAGSQEYEKLSEVYAPAVMFFRHGGYEFLPPCRPHLDGIRPEWDGEE